MPNQATATRGRMVLRRSTTSKLVTGHEAKLGPWFFGFSIVCNGQRGDFGELHLEFVRHENGSQTKFKDMDGWIYIRTWQGVLGESVHQIFQKISGMSEDEQKHCADELMFTAENLHAEFAGRLDRIRAGRDFKFDNT